MTQTTTDNGVTKNAEPKIMSVVGGGSFGVGLVLVLLPAVALYAGVFHFGDNKLVGLPVIAIFGIVVLLGTLALVAMLFQRLGLAQSTEPLGLPPGSMRAAISLALIVLFAIISIMLYLSISEKSEAFRVGGLTEAERNTLVGNAAARIVNVVEAPCAASVPAGAQCATSDRRFDVRMRATPAPEATDLAKQLLILIGTLMTSVTSFYFATRGSAGETSQTGNLPTQPPETRLALRTNPSVMKNVGEHEEDACGGPIEVATADEALPAARGGVAQET